VIYFYLHLGAWLPKSGLVVWVSAWENIQCVEPTVEWHWIGGLCIFRAPPRLTQESIEREDANRNKSQASMRPKNLQ